MPIFVAAQYQPLLRRIGLDAEAVFTHPDIRVWRSIRERENATLDTQDEAGQPVRLHIKRHRPARGGNPAQIEARGIRLLLDAGIGTVPLVAWGNTADGRSFLITADLAGYRPADQLLSSSADGLAGTIAELSARLHTANLHHRDLYLCHFFARRQEANWDVRLIDAGRVRRLPGWPFRRRWIVKDLAQLWYSAAQINPSLPAELLADYARVRRISSLARLRRAVERKARWIARHDESLRRRQPQRNVSLADDASL